MHIIRARDEYRINYGWGRHLILSEVVEPILFHYLKTDLRKVQNVVHDAQGVKCTFWCTERSKGWPYKYEIHRPKGNIAGPRYKAILFKVGPNQYKVQDGSLQFPLLVVADEKAAEEVKLDFEKQGKLEGCDRFYCCFSDMGTDKRYRNAELRDPVKLQAS